MEELQIFGNLSGNLDEPNNLNGKINEVENISGSLEEVKDLSGELNNTIVKVSTDDYNQIKNKPKINGIELKEDKLSIDLGLQDTLKYASNIDIDSLFKNNKENNK